MVHSSALGDSQFPRSRCLANLHHTVSPPPAQLLLVLNLHSILFLFVFVLYRGRLEGAASRRRSNIVLLSSRRNSGLLLEKEKIKGLGSLRDLRRRTQDRGTRAIAELSGWASCEGEVEKWRPASDVDAPNAAFTMGLSREARIITLLVIDTIFFFVELISGAHLPASSSATASTWP